MRPAPERLRLGAATLAMAETGSRHIALPALRTAADGEMRLRGTDRSRTGRGRGRRRPAASNRQATDARAQQRAQAEAMPRAEAPAPAAQRPPTREQAWNEVMRTGLLYAGVLIKVPVTLFFACQFVLFPVILGFSVEDSSFYSCTVALTVLNVIFITFIYVLWYDVQVARDQAAARQQQHLQHLQHQHRHHHHHHHHRQAPQPPQSPQSPQQPPAKEN